MLAGLQGIPQRFQPHLRHKYCRSVDGYRRGWYEATATHFGHNKLREVEVVGRQVGSKLRGLLMIQWMTTTSSIGSVHPEMPLCKGYKGGKMSIMRGDRLSIQV